MGKLRRPHQRHKELHITKACREWGEMVFPRKQHINGLSNTKMVSPENTYKKRYAD